MLPAEMATVADRTRNRTPEAGPEEEDNADDTVVAGEQGEDVDSTASTELDDLPDDHAYRILQKLTAEQVKVLQGNGEGNERNFPDSKKA